MTSGFNKWFSKDGGEGNICQDWIIDVTASFLNSNVVCRECDNYGISRGGVAVCWIFMTPQFTSAEAKCDRIALGHSTVDRTSLTI